MKDVLPTAKDIRQIFFKQQRRKNLLPEHAVLTSRLNDKIVSIRRSMDEAISEDERVKLDRELRLKLEEKRVVEDDYFEDQSKRVADYILNQPNRIRLSKVPSRDGEDREITTLSKRRPTLTLFDRYVALVFTRSFRVPSLGRDQAVRNVLNALRITLGSKTAHRSILKIDIEKYFNSIDHEILLRKLSTHGGVPRFALKHIECVLAAYERIYGRRTGIPQGVPSSSVLSEIYLEGLDERLRQHPQVVLYVRYVDDILIVCHGNEVRTVLEAVEGQLRDLKLRKNDKSKTIEHPSLAATELTYLGYSFSFKAQSGQLYDVDISGDKYNRYLSALDRLKSFAEKQVCWGTSRDVDLFLGAHEYLISPHHSKGDEDSPRIVTGLAYSARYALRPKGPMKRLSELSGSVYQQTAQILGPLLRGKPDTAICPCCGAPVFRAEELFRLQKKKHKASKLLSSQAKPHLDDEIRLRIERLLWNS